MRRAGIFLVPVFIAAYGIFILPYSIGPFAPTSSISYGVGFNNSIAVLALWLAFVAAFGLARLQQQPAQYRPLLDSAPPPRSEDIPRRHLLGACAAYLLLVALIFALVKSDYYSEQGYFLRRFYLVLEGYRPWLDFEFTYGPAFILLPARLSELLSPLGVAPKTAYYLLYGAFSVAGLYLLYLLVQAARLGRRRSVAVFWLLAIALWYPFMGLNANVLRFTAAPASLLLLDRLLREPQLSLRPVAVAAAVIALICANLMLSPEFGVCYWITSSIYLVHRGLGGHQPSWLALAVNMLVPVVLIAVLPQYMGSVLSYAGGGASFPAVPAPHILLYLFGVALVLPLQAAAASRPGIGKDSLGLAFIALAMAVAPGALGRSDPGHIINYGLPSFILVFAALARRGGAGFRLYAATFCVVLTLGNLAANMYIIKRDIAAGLIRGLKPHVSAEQLEERLRNWRLPAMGPGSELRRRIAATQPDLDALLEYPAFGLPMRIEPDIEQFLRVNGRIAPDYYLDNLNVFGLDQVDRKVSDTRRHDWLLVRASYLDAYADPRDCHWETDWQRLERYLSFLLKYPVTLERKHEIPYHRCLIVADLLQHFEPVQAVEGHVVMRRTTRPNPGDADTSR